MQNFSFQEHLKLTYENKTNCYLRKKQKKNFNEPLF